MRLMQQNYPAHIYEPIRQEVANSYLRHELAKYYRCHWAYRVEPSRLTFGRLFLFAGLTGLADLAGLLHSGVAGQ